jgi:YbbR domain-containing protein
MIRRLTENWQYKIFALALATVFWLLIVDESELATTLSAQVEFKNVPRDLVLTSDAPDRVRLEIHGPSSKLKPDALEGIVIVIDLEPVKRPGEYTFSISENNVSLPPGVRLDRALPARIRLGFEPRLTREVPVSVRIGARPADGFEVASVEVYPPRVTVSGAASRVRLLDTVETDPVDLSDVRDYREWKVSAYPPDAQLRLEGSGQVTVRVQVREKAAGPN